MSENENVDVLLGQQMIAIRPITNIFIAFVGTILIFASCLFLWMMNILHQPVPIIESNNLTWVCAWGLGNTMITGLLMLYIAGMGGKKCQ